MPYLRLFPYYLLTFFASYYFAYFSSFLTHFFHCGAVSLWHLVEDHYSSSKYYSINRK